MLRRILTASLQPATVNFVRHLRARRGDPGLRLRMKVFADDFVQHDPETAESLEPNVMNMRQAQKEFIQQEEKHQKKVSRHIVGQKYFKLKQPNFLTWAEKEQIKLLHQQRPEEWTLERLSSSFPADPETISVIIRNQWQPKSEKRILKHDEHVKGNWTKLRNGEIEVEPILTQHLTTFLRRKTNQITPQKVNVDITKKFPKPEKSEFSSIITTCKKYKDDQRNEEVSVDKQQPQLGAGELKFRSRPVDPEDNNMALLVDNNAPKSTKGLKFEEFMKKYPHLDRHEEETVEIFEYAQQQQEQDPVELAQPEPDYRTIEKFQKSQNNSVELRTPNENSMKCLEIQDRIKIPKTVYDKDKTYKVDDCFYDSDGRFMYRVPGLMN